MFKSNRSLVRGTQGKICYLGPKHPALAPIDTLRFPWQESYSDLSYWIASPTASALIDTLSVTYRPRFLKQGTSAHVAENILNDTLAGLGLDIGEQINAKNFYNHTYTLVDERDPSIRAGHVAFGGNRDSAQVYLDATGCSLVRSWSALHKRLESLQGKITRIDLAHDDFAGTHGVDTAWRMLQDGKFNTGGREPKFRLVDEGSGRTLYVGKRRGGKMLRVYEKGKELGCMDSPWVRWEVEYLSKNRDLPLDMLLRPGRYLAGGYPHALQFISEAMTYIKTQTAKAKIVYRSAVDHMKKHYGKLINVMFSIEGTAQAVVEQLINREGVPKRLIFPTLVPSPASNTGLKFGDTPF